MSDFLQPVASLFRTATRDSAGLASQYTEGLLSSLQRKNMERMEEAIPGVSRQNLQQFISDSPWSHRALMDHVALQAAAFLGPHPDLCLHLDESCFAKKGPASAGVARQWNGRLGKVDNCQVGVFAALNRGAHSALIDAALYLPKAWVEDIPRCAKAGLPPEEILLRSKCDLAFALVKRALEKGLQPAWVGVDAGYGKNTAFLQRLEDELGACFMADIPKSRRVWLERPEAGSLPCREVLKKGVKVAALDGSGAGLPAWREVTARRGPGGPVTVQARALRVWLWSGRKKDAPRQWWLLSRQIGGVVKHSLSNAPEDTGLPRLVFMAGQRYFIERAFEDGKSSVGMAGYQVRKWLGWHHHMAMVMLASFFLLKERLLAAETLPELTVADLVYVLHHLLPRRGVITVDAEAISEQLDRRLARKRRSAKAEKKN